MTDHTLEKVKQIKRSFRLFMNGVASRSMRDKGMEYKIIWGVPLIQLRRIASEYAGDYELSVALWQDDVRECKILATMIMPPAMMLQSMAEQWLAECKTSEMVEMLALNLFQHLDYAEVLVYKWFETTEPMPLLCAFHTLSRLLCKNFKPSASSISSILHAIRYALSQGDLTLKHAATNCLVRLLSVDDSYAIEAHEVLKPLNLDIFQ